MKTVAYEALATLAGQDIGVSDWLLVDQERVTAFALATLDEQWIHVDVARAMRELGGTIAHGYLTLALLPALSYTLLHVTGASRTINYGVDRVRFTQAVPVGSCLRLVQRCTRVEPKAGGMLVHMHATIERKGAERPACVAETLSLFLA